MKRIAVLIAALLLFSCAAAEALSPYAVKFIADYNIYADTVFGVPHLPLTGWACNDFNYKLTEDGIQFDISVLSEKHIYADILIDSATVDGDFIAKCACMAAALSGSTKGIYDSILTMYFKCRINPSGEQLTLSTNEGYMIMQKEENLFFFGMGL